ncbi:MAG TPA: hypothetical protein VEA39_07585 [Methylophilaceae bacterium]|nr:hypothetical protein [Methylophilaceae bacterium]
MILDILRAVAIIVVFYLGLYLVQDPEPPRLIITSEQLPMQCPVHPCELP